MIALTEISDAAQLRVGTVVYIPVTVIDARSGRAPVIGFQSGDDAVCRFVHA